MRTTIHALFGLLSLTIAASEPIARSAGADDGAHILQFLRNVQKNQLAIEIDRIGPHSKPPEVGPRAPALGRFPAAYFPAGCCGDDARQKLNDALQVSSQPLPTTFQPDYCIVHW